MAKDKKKIGIKTSKYYTKNCTACGSSYPNWFTNCPKCGLGWDEAKESAKEVENIKKTIKIVVKITEEDFEESINMVQLIFSGDQGKSWFKTKMAIESDYFIAEIEDVPHGTIIIYYIEVFLANGEKYIENNEGKYFYYKVGAPIEESEEEPSASDSKTIQNNITSQNPNSSISEASNQKISVFGKPQTEIDPDLKTCSKCNSKIKKVWNTCPFCGNKV